MRISYSLCCSSAAAVAFLLAKSPFTPGSSGGVEGHSRNLARPQLFYEYYDDGADALDGDGKTSKDGFAQKSGASSSSSSGPGVGRYRDGDGYDDGSSAYGVDSWPSSASTAAAAVAESRIFPTGVAAGDRAKRILKSRSFSNALRRHKQNELRKKRKKLKNAYQYAYVLERDPNYKRSDTARNLGKTAEADYDYVYAYELEPTSSAKTATTTVPSGGTVGAGRFPSPTKKPDDGNREKPATAKGNLLQNILSKVKSDKSSAGIMSGTSKADERKSDAAEAGGRRQGGAGGFKMIYDALKAVDAESSTAGKTSSSHGGGKSRQETAAADASLLSNVLGQDVQCDSAVGAMGLLLLINSMTTILKEVMGPRMPVIGRRKRGAIAEETAANRGGLLFDDGVPTTRADADRSYWRFVQPLPQFQDPGDERKWPRISLSPSPQLAADDSLVNDTLAQLAPALRWYGEYLVTPKKDVLNCASQALCQACNSLTHRYKGDGTRLVRSLTSLLMGVLPDQHSRIQASRAMEIGCSAAGLDAKCGLPIAACPPPPPAGERRHLTATGMGDNRGETETETPEAATGMLIKGSELRAESTI